VTLNAVLNILLRLAVLVFVVFGAEIGEAIVKNDLSIDTFGPKLPLAMRSGGASPITEPAVHASCSTWNGWAATEQYRTEIKRQFASR
jgi:hypothetical protein